MKKVKICVVETVVHEQEIEIDESVIGTDDEAEALESAWCEQMDVLGSFENVEDREISIVDQD